MRKLLLITLDFPPIKGGISRMFSELRRHLPNNKIVVLTESAGRKVTDKGNKIYRARLLSCWFWPRWFFMFWRGLNIIKKEKIKLVQAGQILPVGTVAWLYKKWLKVPYHVYVYGQDLVISRHHPRKMKLIKMILQGAEKVIACSHYTKQLAEKIGADSAKIAVIYPLIKTEVISFQTKEVASFLAKKNLSGKKIILSAGNLVARKGVDRLLSAMPQIIKKVPSAFCLIVGDGPERPRFERLARDLGLTSNVSFAGRVPDRELAISYTACHLFAMLSRELKDALGQVVDVEGFGMVYLEANLYAKPVLAGRSGGVPDAVKDGYSGILVDPENTEEIAAAAVKLLTDQELALRLGQQGKKMVLDEFRPENEAAKIKLLLN